MELEVRIGLPWGGQELGGAENIHFLIQWRLPRCSLCVNSFSYAYICCVLFCM